MNQKYKGIIYIIISAFCFALMNMFVHLAGDLPSVQKSFFRNLVAFFFAVIIMARKRIWFSGKKENIAPLFYRAIFWDRWNSVQLLCGRPSSAGGCFYAE